MSETSEDTNMVTQLELASIIGFNGKVGGGLIVHPNKQHLIYPLGCTVIIKDIKTNKPEILWGHTDTVSCITVSKSGKYIASGQNTYQGFKADIIVWNFEERTLYCRLTLHMVKVEALSFSPTDIYLASLGGEDDGSVVIWNIAKKDAICGSPAQVMSAGTTYCVAFSNKSDDTFVTGGDLNVRVWKLDVDNRKIWPTEVNMAHLKRVIKCIEIAEDDAFFYCGTTTGDIFAVNMKSCLFQQYGPEKDRFSRGITTLKLLNNDDILVGAGDGSVNVVKGMKKMFKRTRKYQQVQGSVSSLAKHGNDQQFLVGTDVSHIYGFDFVNFDHELNTTSHYSKVNDIAFPRDSSEIVATCSYQDIRVWHLPQAKEVLRITVPNMNCNAISFMADGKSIISGWDDSRIRAFYPNSGKLMYTIDDAAKLGVTALATTRDSSQIVSGGGDGEVRMWKIKHTPCMKGDSYSTELFNGMKEHKAFVTCIQIKSNDTECVTSSEDGTCIIWDMIRASRLKMIRANTLFKFACYNNSECQVITSGSDRKIGYWETFDGSMVRELEGSTSGCINGMDIAPNGLNFVTGGDDQLIKVWSYNEGETTHVGIGHSGAIQRVKISPNSKYIVSISSDGAILCWNFPVQTS